MPLSHAAQTARVRLAQVRGQLTEVARQLNEDLGAANSYRDDYLSQAGLDAKRRELAGEARDRHQDSLEKLARAISYDVSIVRESVNSSRPAIGSDAAALMRSQMKWDQVRMRLQSGMPMTRVLATADTETALAIREWAPAWLEAQSYEVAPNGSGLADVPAVDVDGLLRSVDDRLAAQSVDFAEVVKASRQVEEIAAAAEPTLGYLTQRLSGGPSDGLAAAIASHSAAARATRPFVEPPQPAEVTA
ncbi:MAG: hypothetical protein CMH83_20005 [Nocardioides sp.]|nr:hypothetical protein [Nocardioides sp.]